MSHRTINQVVRSGNLLLVCADRAGVRLPPAADFAAPMAAALRRYGPRRPALVTLAVTRDREMRSLNRRYRGRSRSTDVLAFPDGDLDRETGRVILGDIIICRDRAAAESRARRGVSVRDELVLYALHGMLHLLGFRDKTPAERKAMEAEQDRFLKKQRPAVR
jgi:probable rRNA maturation factor